MTSIEPKVVLNGHYSVSEAAAILQQHRNTILNHCNNGTLKCGFSRSNHRKFFTGAELLRFWNAKY